jgi:hypothetical protein
MVFSFDSAIEGHLECIRIYLASMPIKFGPTKVAEQSCEFCLYKMMLVGLTYSATSLAER